MQSRRAGFLGTGQNEIEPLDFATPGAKHRRNVTEIFCNSYSISRSFWSAAASSHRFWGHRAYARKAVRRRPALPKHFARNQKNGRSCRAHLGILCWHMISRKLCCIATTCAIGWSVSALADQGMWLFNAPPLKQLKEKYQFEPTPQWLEHLQKASVRFNSGGSGSFVSANGLVITNHHVGADALQKASSEQHNYLKDGFHAKTNADEIKCADLELNVLISIEDVTARVNAAVKPDVSADDASKARGNAIAEIEKESKEKTGLRSDVVTLYQGGAYHLYRYKRYDDVRIVFAPEQQMAFYGGDPDNFEYPRFDLDICIFRAYENGQPAKIDNYLKFSSRGPSDGELTFVSGHPAKTDRQLTLDELADMRDRELPRFLSFFKRREILLHSFGERSFENSRRVREDYYGVTNNRKRYDGYLAGLLDPDVWKALQAREQKLRDAISAD